MKRLSLIIIGVLCFVVPTQGITRAQLTQYAASLQGKKKSELKTAIYQICQAQYVLSYGSGEGKTWSGFYQTDRIGTNRVLDRYSNEIFEFTDETSSVTGMNIEHSFPKSWWGGTENNAYKDLYNLMPSESSINQSKSNNGMGVVTQITRDNDCTKVGKGTTSGNTLVSLWEPADKWKGDFSRSYFYMATIYQNFTWQGEALNSLEQNTWPTLQQWAYTLYLSWVRADGVSYTEVARNNKVANIQSNRNLFVDFPYLAEYVWGDSVNVAFDPNTALTTASDETRFTPTGEPVDDTETEEIVYDSDDIFALVTDFSTLESNDVVLIVNTQNRVAMSTTQNANNRGMSRVKIIGDEVVGSYNEAQRIKIEITGDYVRFNTGEGYLYAASSSANYLRTQTTPGDNAKASVTIDSDGTATILFNGVSRNALRFNKANSLFSCYDPSISNQTTPVQLYKLQLTLARGDVNGDGNVDIQDVTTLVDLILGKITSVTGEPDIDGDGNVNIQDVTALVDIILGK